MTEDELMKLYDDLNKLLSGKQLDHALIAVGTTVANIAHISNIPIMHVLGLINKTALESFGKILEEENESTKH